MTDQPVAGSWGPERAWRVGDRDRDAAVEALGEHYATGRLDKDEYDERSDLAYAARTDVELRRLFTDLPPPHGPVAAPAQPDQTYQAGAGEWDRRRTHRPTQRRGPFGPWLLLVVPLVALTHAFWLLWLVPVLLWCAVRSARRHARAPRRQAVTA